MGIVFAVNRKAVESRNMWVMSVRLISFSEAVFCDVLICFTPFYQYLTTYLCCVELSSQYLSLYTLIIVWNSGDPKEKKSFIMNNKVLLDCIKCSCCFASFSDLWKFSRLPFNILYHKHTFIFKGNVTLKFKPPHPPPRAFFLPPPPQVFFFFLSLIFDSYML